MLEKVSAIDIRRNADFGVDYCHGSIQYDENWETVQKFIGNETQSTFVKKFPSKPVETRRNIRTLYVYSLIHLFLKFSFKYSK